LSALPTTLNNTCRSRTSSSSSPRGNFGSISVNNPTPFSPALIEKSFSISSTNRATETGSYCNSSLPASILDRSRMSLMSVSKVRPLDEIASR